MKQLKAQHIGLITGATMIGISLVSFYQFKIPIESNVQLLIYGVFTAGIVCSLFIFHKTTAKAKNFKDYFSEGFKTFVIVALLMAVFTFIFFSYNTGFRDDKIAENNRLLLLEGNKLPKEIEENAKQLRKLFMPIMVSSAMFRYLIIGAIISLVGAGFLSQKKTTA